MSDKVSIAVATYNGQKYIREQLESFLCQTRRPDEVIFSDDASNDGTLDILREFSARAPFDVRIVANGDRQGYSRNFERAIELCSGGIIFLSDQDDVWHPSKIEIMVGVLAQGEYQVAICDHTITDAELQPFGVTTVENIRSMGGADRNFVYGCCTAFRREWLDIVLPIPHAVCSHDVWLNDLATDLGVRGMIDEPLLLFRRHDDTATNWLLTTGKKTNRWRVAFQYGLGDARDGWRKEISMVNARIGRLLEKRSALEEMGLRRACEHAIRNNSDHVSALCERIEIVSRSRPARLLSVASFLRNRGYDHFQGWRSALKDCLR